MSYLPVFVTDEQFMVKTIILETVVLNLMCTSLLLNPCTQNSCYHCIKKMGLFIFNHRLTKGGGVVALHPYGFFPGRSKRLKKVT